MLEPLTFACHVPVMGGDPAGADARSADHEPRHPVRCLSAAHVPCNTTRFPSITVHDPCARFGVFGFRSAVHVPWKIRAPAAARHEPRICSVDCAAAATVRESVRRRTNRWLVDTLIGTRVVTAGRAAIGPGQPREHDEDPYESEQGEEGDAPRSPIYCAEHVQTQADQTSRAEDTVDASVNSHSSYRCIKRIRRKLSGVMPQIRKPSLARDSCAAPFARQSGLHRSRDFAWCWCRYWPARDGIASTVRER